ncbi:MAG: archease [Candidatus Altiarchaeota archaeon]
MDYEFLEHTADLKFRAYGGSLEECLVNAARALLEAVAGDSRVEPKIEREIKVVINRPEVLVHDFLSELIYLFSTEHLLFGEFELSLKESLGYKLVAKVRGEEYDPKRHTLIKEVKAVTYHDMLVEKGDDGRWVVQVVCDT